MIYKKYSLFYFIYVLINFFENGEFLQDKQILFVYFTIQGMVKYFYDT